MKFFQEILPVFIGQTGKGKSAIAVIRISGPCSREVLTKVACLKEHQLEPRKALFRKLYNPENGELLDNGIVIWFPGPKSYTGEDSAELHIHGGFAVQCAVINALQKLPGFRIAEPGRICFRILFLPHLDHFILFYHKGEFTKRAFIAGKLDATEVEGLADLLRAETDSQRRQALRLANGELAQLYNLWRVSIINCMANLEAYVDFGEDQDIGDEVLSSLENSVSLLIDEIEIHLNDNRRGERLRHGVKVAIIGEPNVGKSSLLNLLSIQISFFSFISVCDDLLFDKSYLGRREAAIVSPFAGTTRDVLEISLDIGGFPVVLCDTAGLRLSDDPVENEGLKRAKSIASMADLVMIVVDPSKISALERSSLTDFIDDQCSQLNVQTGNISSDLTSVFQ